MQFRNLYNEFHELANAIVKYIENLSDRKVSEYHFTKSRASNLPQMKSFLKLLEFHMNRHGRLHYKELEDKYRANMAFELVWNSIVREERPTIHPRHLQRQYLDLEECITQDPAVNIAWAYLHQFHTELRHFDLGEDLRIRAATPLERALFNQKGVSERGRTSSSFIIETRHSKGFLRSELSENEKVIMQHLDLVVRNQFRDAVSIMRIMSPSGTGITSVWYRIDHGGIWSELEQIPFPDLVPPALCPMGEVTCRLAKKQVKLARKLWYRLRRIREDVGNQERLLRAVERFDTALCSSRDEDLVRDIYVVFETLFHARGRRLDETIALLVSDNKNEMDTVQATLRKGRKVRNSSTHGSRMRFGIEPELIHKIVGIAADIVAFTLASMGVNEGLEGLADKALVDNAFWKKLRKKLIRWSPQRLQE